MERDEEKLKINDTGIEEKSTNGLKTKVYKRRWYMLGVYVFYTVCNSSQWLQYVIISNVATKFYGVSNWSLNLTSLVMMGAYLVLALPAANLMDKISLRWTAILGSTGTAVGSCMKLFSATTHGFYMTLAGQTVVAVSQVLILSVPQKLSSVWFGENEVSSACSIGIFGFQFGLVVGFFFPPLLVSNHASLVLIGQDMFRMFLYFATFSCVAALLVVLTFQNEPPVPPTLSQTSARAGLNVKTSYLLKLKRLFSQYHLSAFFVLTGINNGCFNGLSTLLNQIFLNYFPDNEKDSGNIGVTMIVFGMIASVTYGYFLDRTKKFKFVLIGIYYMSAVAITTFTVLLIYAKRVWLIYLAAAFVGTFLCGFTAVSMDVATEITYPESEMIVGTIMNMMSLMFTFATTLIFGFINERLGYFWGNVSFVATLVVGASCMLPIKFEQKRTAAQKAKTKESEQRVLI